MGAVSDHNPVLELEMLTFPTGLCSFVQGASWSLDNLMGKGAWTVWETDKAVCPLRTVKMLMMTAEMTFNVVQVILALWLLLMGFCAPSWVKRNTRLSTRISKCERGAQMATYIFCTFCV